MRKRNEQYGLNFVLPGQRRLSFRALALFITLLSLGALLTWNSRPALAQESISQEPTPSSVEGIVNPMEKSYVEKELPPSQVPGIKERLKEAPAFFRDTKLDVQLRSYYLRQTNSGSQTKEAWAIGGSLAYRSGFLYDRFAVGGTLYTSQPLYAPDDRDGTSLLAPGQEGYTVLGQAYGKVKLAEENFLNIYRQEYNTPFINKNDFRMTPNTFEGYSVQGAVGKQDGGPRLSYGLGYIDKIKTRNDSTFQSMSYAAGAKVARGVFAEGFNFSYRGFQIGAIDYYSEDIINIGYGETKYRWKLTDQLGAIFSGQFVDQRSVGGNLLTGSSFHGTQFGLMTNVSYRNGILTLGYTNTGGGANIQNPWGVYPGYTSVQVKDFNRAGEDAFIVKASYNFARFGLEELSAYALWIHGWNAIDPATNRSVFQQDEFDFDLQWRPKSDKLKGIWFRARYAYVESRGEPGAGYPINDIRFILNYDFQLL